MSFDEMYDEMLHGEFSAGEGDEATAATAAGQRRGRHAAASQPVSDYERPVGILQRYRTAGLVGAGGLACAAAGAFLGGLGGYFTVAPAAAHPVASSSSIKDLPVAQAADHAATSNAAASASHGASAVDAISFSKVSGSLAQSIAPFQSLTTDPLQVLSGTSALPPLPVTTGTTGPTSGGGGGGTPPGGGGTPPPGGGTSCTTTSDLGLGCLLSNLTGLLTNLGALGGSNPAGSLLNGLVPTLDSVVSDVSGLLGNLNSVLPLGTTAGTGTPTSVLAGATSPVTSAPATTGSKAGAAGATNALGSVLNAVGAAASGATGSGTSSLPSLPLSTGSGASAPSQPSTTPSGSTTAPTSSSTTPAAGSSGSGTTITIPLPIPVTIPTINIGGLSVGLNSNNSGGGLTLHLGL